MATTHKNMRGYALLGKAMSTKRRAEKKLQNMGAAYGKLLSNAQNPFKLKPYFKGNEWYKERKAQKVK